MLSFLSFVVAGLLAFSLIKHRGRPFRARQGAVALLCLAILGFGVWHWPSPFMLRKVIATLLMPTALIWLALIGAFLSCREPSAARGALGVILAGYTLAGNGGVAGLALRALEAPYLDSRPMDDGRTYEAVFVLGGGASIGVGGSAQLSDHGDRLRLPAALYHAGRTPLLISSGSGTSGFDLAAMARRVWISLGVPPQAIVTLPAPRNTEQEVAAYSEMIATRNLKRVGLVTSASHMRRAQAHCRRYGLQMTALPTDFRSVTSGLSWRDFVVPGREDFFWLVPSGYAFEALETALWEYYGLLALRLSVG